MTYNAFSGTLNPTQSINLGLDLGTQVLGLRTQVLGLGIQVLALAWP